MKLVIDGSGLIGNITEAATDGDTVRLAPVVIQRIADDALLAESRFEDWLSHLISGRDRVR